MNATCLFKPCGYMRLREWYKAFYIARNIEVVGQQG